LKFNNAIGIHINILFELAMMQAISHYEAVPMEPDFQE
jgi:hypothetical protein